MYSDVDSSLNELPIPSDWLQIELFELAKEIDTLSLVPLWFSAVLVKMNTDDEDASRLIDLVSRLFDNLETNDNLDDDRYRILLELLWLRIQGTIRTLNDQNSPYSNSDDLTTVHRFLEYRRLETDVRIDSGSMRRWAADWPTQPFHSLPEMCKRLLLFRFRQLEELVLIGTADLAILDLLRISADFPGNPMNSRWRRMYRLEKVLGSLQAKQILTEKLKTNNPQIEQAGLDILVE